MTARRRSEPFAPTPRMEGPPGIDWTQAAPECPACLRTWVAADLPTGALLSRRTHAALVAAVLAISSTAPTAVLAASHPHHGGHKGLHDSDPGDTGVSLPVSDSPPAPGAPEPDPPEADPESPDPGTSEVPQPVVGESGPEAPGDGGAVPDQPAPDDENPAPQAPYPPPTSATQPTPPAEPSTATSAPPAVTGAPHGLRAQRHIIMVRADSHRSRTLPSRQTMRPVTSGSTGRTVAIGAVAAAVRADRTQLGDRSYVVRPGDSLWSIATDLLGGRASSARIAAEVQRLWQLNRERIGSGDPDVLLTGTHLTLR